AAGRPAGLGLRGQPAGRGFGFVAGGAGLAVAAGVVAGGSAQLGPRRGRFARVEVRARERAPAPVSAPAAAAATPAVAARGGKRASEKNQSHLTSRPCFYPVPWRGTRPRPPGGSPLLRCSRSRAARRRRC